MLLSFLRKKKNAKERYAVSIVPLTDAYAKPQTLNFSSIRRGIVATALLILVLIALIVAALSYILSLRLRMSDQYSSTLGLSEYIEQLEAHVTAQTHEIESLRQRLNLLLNAPNNVPKPQVQPQAALIPPLFGARDTPRAAFGLVQRRFKSISA